MLKLFSVVVIGLWSQMMRGEERITQTQTSAGFFDDFSAARRRDQNQTTPGYILTPAAANIPGLGFTYGILGSFFNVNNSEMDVLGFKFWGDLEGQGAGVVDLFIIPQYPDLLTLNLFWNSFSKVGVETHRRGIKSDPDQRNLIELSDFEVTVAQLNLRLLERRLQFNVSGNTQRLQLSKVRNKDGDVVTEGNGQTQRAYNRAYGSILDLTDDRFDPRKGMSAEVYRYDRPDPGGYSPHFYTLEYNFLFYVPTSSRNTLAFNAYRSDAHVMRKGETDPSVIKSRLAFNCDSKDEQCLSLEKQYLSEELAQNKYGTATPLGGTQRLRSYVTNRFSGAHSQFFGTEFRWNLTEEFTPFNVIVAGGVRTGVQVALFAETGTVSDYESELNENYKSSMGAGVRFVMASGFVVRLDMAHGDEGTQPTFIFQYPWTVF